MNLKGNIYLKRAQNVAIFPQNLPDLSRVSETWWIAGLEEESPLLLLVLHPPFLGRGSALRNKWRRAGEKYAITLRKCGGGWNQTASVSNDAAIKMSAANPSRLSHAENNFTAITTIRNKTKQKSPHKRDSSRQNLLSILVNKNEPRLSSVLYTMDVKVELGSGRVLPVLVEQNRFGTADLPRFRPDFMDPGGSRQKRCWRCWWESILQPWSTETKWAESRCCIAAS